MLASLLGWLTVLGHLLECASMLVTPRMFVCADIQLLNNHTILHARTAFVDWEVRQIIRQSSACADSVMCQPVCCFHIYDQLRLNADALLLSLQDPEKQRHLLRLWLSPDDDRPLPAYCKS